MENFFRAGGQAVLRTLRRHVSADKQRYEDPDHGYDVDLTYITDRIIAMSYPASGMESVFRNDINEVSALLQSLHNENYRIYNLSQRPYDYLKFKGQVVDWCGWPDHHAPPLLLLLRLLSDMYEFLEEDSRNVVLVHCLAGKGRTGVAIASLLVYSHLFQSTSGARAYYASMRSRAKWGVVQPMQVRYCDYIGVLQAGTPVIPLQMHVNQIRVQSLPSLFLSPGKTGCYLQIKLSQWRSPPLPSHDTNNASTHSPHSNNNWSFASEPLWVSGVFPIGDEDGGLTVNVGIPLEGDIVLTLEHHGIFGVDVFGVFVFNVDMVPHMRSYTPGSTGDTLKLSKADFDRAEKDKRVSPSFSVNVGFYLSPNPNPQSDWRDEWKRAPTTFKPALLFGDENLSDKVQRAQNYELVEAPSSEAPLLEHAERGGWLMKVGGKVKTWKSVSLIFRRWFVLQPDRMEYFIKPNSTAPQGTIAVRDIISVNELVLPTPQPSQYHFQIYTNERVYSLYAFSEVEREQWLESILAAIRLCEIDMEHMRAESPAVFSLSITGLRTNRSLKNPYVLVSRVRRDGSGLESFRTPYATGSPLSITHRPIEFGVHEETIVVVQLFDSVPLFGETLIGEIPLLLPSPFVPTHSAASSPITSSRSSPSREQSPTSHSSTLSGIKHVQFDLSALSDIDVSLPNPTLGSGSATSPSIAEPGSTMGPQLAPESATTSEMPTPPSVTLAPVQIDKYYTLRSNTTGVEVGTQLRLFINYTPNPEAGAPKERRSVLYRPNDIRTLATNAESDALDSRVSTTSLTEASGTGTASSFVPANSNATTSFGLNTFSCGPGLAAPTRERKSGIRIGEMKSSASSVPLYTTQSSPPSSLPSISLPDSFSSNLSTETPDLSAPDILALNDDPFNDILTLSTRDREILAQRVNLDSMERESPALFEKDILEVYTKSNATPGENHHVDSELSTTLSDPSEEFGRSQAVQARLSGNRSRSVAHSSDRVRLRPDVQSSSKSIPSPATTDSAGPIPSLASTSTLGWTSGRVDSRRFANVDENYGPPITDPREGSSLLSSSLHVDFEDDELMDSSNPDTSSIKTVFGSPGAELDSLMNALIDNLDDIIEHM